MPWQKMWENSLHFRNIKFLSFNSLTFSEWLSQHVCLSLNRRRALAHQQFKTSHHSFQLGMFSELRHNSFLAKPELIICDKEQLETSNVYYDFRYGKVFEQHKHDMPWMHLSPKNVFYCSLTTKELCNNVNCLIHMWLDIAHKLNTKTANIFEFFL